MLRLTMIHFTLRNVSALLQQMQFLNCILFVIPSIFCFIIIFLHGSVVFISSKQCNVFCLAKQQELKGFLESLEVQIKNVGITQTER